MKNPIFRYAHPVTLSDVVYRGKREVFCFFSPKIRTQKLSIDRGHLVDGGKLEINSNLGGE